MSPEPAAGQPPEEEPDLVTTVFRLPRSAYLIVLFLSLCVIPLGFTADGTDGAEATIGPRALLVLIPVLAGFYISRTATLVDVDGIRVRALLGTRALPWDRIRGLSVRQTAIYAELGDGAIRLPCVRLVHLAALARASGGRLPAIADAPPKFAPSRRRR